MGMPNVAQRRWSVEDVWALPDVPGTRYECVDGELLVSPAPRFSHQIAVTQLLVALDAFLHTNRIGLVVAAPSDVVLDPFTLVQPDVHVVPLADGRPADDEPLPTPMLAIEVLSPSSARQDRYRKRPRYQRAGVECWLVDIGSRLVERWTPEAELPEVLEDEIVWKPDGVDEPLRIDLKALFREVTGTG